MLLSARRLIVLVFVSAVGVLVFASASAVAAAPEAPGSVTVERVGASRVTVRGVLSPGGEGHPGTYEFLYKESKVGPGCEGAGKAPGPPGLALGFEHEEVSQELTGLKPESEYTVCLSERNPKGEETVGPLAMFKTVATLEAPQTGEPLPGSITVSSVKLQGVLNPHNPGDPGTYEFVYRESPSECQRENPQTQQNETEYTTSTESALGGEKEVVSPPKVGGLNPDVDYTYCLLVRNEAGETALGSPVTFTTLSEKPSISGESVSRLGSTSATVSAQIGRGAPEASYRVQYGTSSAYGLETALVSISYAATQTVLVPLTGLQPGTKYYFRFVATNADGGEVGAGSTFSSYSVTTGGLPDGRVYELVSPVENRNADVYELDEGLMPTRRLFQAAAGGNSVAYVGQSTVGGNGSTGDNGGDEYLATRSPQGGWSQINITPVGSNIETVYKGFSSELSTGFLEVPSVEAPFTTTDNLAERNNGNQFYTALYAHAFDEGLYRPLSVTTPYRTFTAGSQIYNREFEESYAGSSADGNDVLFSSNDALLDGEGSMELESELDSTVKKEVEVVAEGTRITKGLGALTEEEEELELLVPGHKCGESPACVIKQAEKRKIEGELEAFEAVNNSVDNRSELYVSVDGRVSLVNVLDGKLVPGAVFGGADLSHVISADGSRIFWTDPESGVVYMREYGSSTVQVSAGSAVFWTASTDGKYAFYTEAGALWRFDVEDGSRVEIAGAAGGVQGVVGTNETGEDGAYVYFVANEKLTSEENSAKQEAVEGEEDDNLYAYEPDPQAPGGSKIAFIGLLSPSDGSDWTHTLGSRTVSMTPKGQGLVFQAVENLTGGTYPGEGSENEVYVYDAGDGSVFCASCRAQASGGHVPDNYSQVYERRLISADGDQVFFDSEAPLVSRDVNGAQDVYEWERDGSGGCVETTGCVYLLSGGVEGAAYLVDASVSGSDVFFVARQNLVSEARNEDSKLYDARVDGVLGVASPECTGTGCQGVPAPPPIFATPASVTFNGVGNFSLPVAKPVVKSKAKTKSVKCKKGEVKKKGKCVKKGNAKRRAKKSAKGRK